MDRWDALLLAAAGYVSVMSLVRLMAHRRNELMVKIRDEMIRQRAAADAARAAAEEEADAA
ncbi:MAG TPA: hypothetical protein PKC18_11730 [Lacipirellulaceae bacterium]|nr:hypothetical protein [Lacipirellulaceae bacterium]